MKMKMKDSKMMLAMFVVAALAFAGVAGAAFASENAQAADPAIFVPNLNVNEVKTDNYGVFLNSAGTTTAVIKANCTLTGELWFGTYYLKTAGGTEREFVPLVKLTLDKFGGKTDIVFNYSYNANSVSVQGKTAGTVKVTEGKIFLCSSANAADYFAGTVKGNTATLTLENVIAGTANAGLFLQAGTTDIVGGEVKNGNQPDDKGVAMTVAKIKIEGKAKLYGFSGKNDTKTVIAAGAEVTGSVDTSYSLAPAGGANIELTVGAGTSNNCAVGAILNSAGTAVAKVETPVLTTANNNVITFVVNNGVTINPLDKYTAVIGFMSAAYGGTIDYSYVGTVTFDSYNLTGSTLTVKARLSEPAAVTNDTTAPASRSDAALTLDSKFNASDYEFVYAQGVKGNNGTNAAGSYAASTRILTITGMADSNSDVFFAVFKDLRIGKYVTIAGKAAGAGATTMNAVTDLTVGDTAAAGIIAHGKISTALTPVPHVVLVGSAASKTALTVDGTFNIVYAGGTANGRITQGNNEDIIVNGTMKYETSAAAEPLVCSASSDIVLKAGCTVAKSDTDPRSVYTYTTLEEAMKKADFTVYGSHKILKDTVLAGTPVGTETAQNKITIATDSGFEIGQNKDAANNKEQVTAVLTVPVTTKLTLDGKITVTDGKFVTAGNTIDLTGKVVADIFMKKTDGVYADMATALSAAVSDDVLTTRNTVTLSKNAEIKAGVKLSTTGYVLTVGNGAVLTVSGELDSSGRTPVLAASTSTAAAGEIVFKSTKFKAANFTANDGKMTFAKEFDNTAAPGDTNFVAGTITFAGTATKHAVLNVEGKAKLTIADASEIDINVTGEFEYVTLTGTAAKIYLTVTGTGVVKTPTALTVIELVLKDKAKVADTSAVTIGRTATPIAGKAFIGNPASSLTQGVCGVEAKNLILSDGGASTEHFATVYGKADKVTVTKQGTASSTFSKTEFKIADANKAWSLYQTIYGGRLTATAASVMALPDVEVTGYVSASWYSNQGCTTLVQADTVKCGTFATIYSVMDKATYKVTFPTIEGIEWLVDGKLVNNIGYGDMYLEYGAHTVKFRAVKGYDASNVKVTMNGQTYTAGQSFNLSDAASFAVVAGSEPTENPAKSEFGIVEIMLVIITIMVVIMAVIIALKLMRS